MKKLAMILGVLLLSTSCIELNGRLNVNDSLVVKKKSGFLNLKTKEQELKAGSYTAQLNIKSDKNVSLEISGGSLDKKIIVPIKAENDLNIPGDGKFAIAHDKIAQPFDVVGHMNTDVTYGETQYAVESCTWTATERRCDKVCAGEPRKCDSICKDIEITHEGRKDVTFHYSYTRRDVQLEIMRAGSTALAATLNASSSESSKVIEHASLCRIR